ncbi:MAG: AbrB/MazE/SpoVT family DNA-binding domain-containing protein [Chloroflexota bacterium]|nr:AbrB/MazE/SpoVT family DNA-binding domain-containing protein [Chloroflexota bacterium]
MLARLSSKGQLVIPKPVRDLLGLRKGTQFQVRTEGGRIILEPVGPSSADTLYGKYADADFLTALEEEHRREIEGEAALCP